jgi:spore coat polysaccharide biosynthesis protein SpsF (cytidylyltransferase family)
MREIVVRVTGDNPFTDPASIDRVVDQLIDGFDYAIEMVCQSAPPARL